MVHIKFCPACDNILIPRKKKLYCKACEEEYDASQVGASQEDYKIIKKIRHDEAGSTPIIIKEGLKGERISDQDRKAYEEFFTGSEESGY